jgi:PleD family two-component response regulator
VKFFVKPDHWRRNVNGLDLSGFIRWRLALTDFPVLIISTESLKENVSTAVKEGVSNYIANPFTPRRSGKNSTKSSPEILETP